MGQIVRTTSPAYVSAAEAILNEAKIPVIVQQLSPEWGGPKVKYLLTVPDLKHGLALKILKRADLDPAKADAEWQI